MSEVIKLNDMYIDFSNLKGYLKQIETNVNELNSGFYCVADNNLPVAGTYFFLFVISYADTRVVQFAYSIGFPFKLYNRYKLNNEWSAWKSITFS